MASSQPSYAGMSSSRDAPNPLRPYYVPPSIGVLPDQPINSSATTASAGSTASIGRSAKDFLPDLDYGVPLLDKDGPSIGEVAKKIVDQALWKYTSVLLAQPFDVAKTILQVRLAAAREDEADVMASKRSSMQVEVGSRRDEYDLSEPESSDEEPSYFTPSKPPKDPRVNDDTPRQRRRSHRRPSPADRSSSATPVPRSSETSSPSHKLHLRQPDSILETLSQLWQHGGATGLWKATNATFIYNVLAKAVESWTRSLLCALLNLPDPGALIGGPSDMVASAMGGLDVTDSPLPLASLGVAVAAAAIAGVLLSPLDLVRTKLIITPTSISPRAILPTLQSLPSLTPPTTLLPITLLHSTLSTLITTSTPLFLRQSLNIDPHTTPSAYSIASFATSTAELFLKLPLETVLRRGQVHVLKHHHQLQRQRLAQSSKSHLRNSSSRSGHSSSDDRRSSSRPTSSTASTDLQTVVDVGAFRGVFGTVWTIAFEEGYRAPRALSSQTFKTPSKVPGVQQQRPQGKKGQGLQGLWRGWNVGMWGLIGVWGASALGGAGSSRGGVGSEF